jgi:hypothetical protein
MKRPIGLLAAVALLLGGVGQAKADILFNDYGPAYTYQTNTGWTVSGPTSAVGSSFANANEFTPLLTGAVTSVDFGIGLVSGTNSAVFQLMTDNGGVPGSVLESYSFVNQMGSFGTQNGPLVATSLSQPTLVAGTNYWMVALPGASDTWAAWNLNDQGVSGTDAISQDGGSTWQPNGSQTFGAFEVFGNAGPVVPEPASLTLLGIGIAGIAGYGWRRRKQPVPA